MPQQARARGQPGELTREWECSTSTHAHNAPGVQFIYNAVAANCVEVATHRHGCCVLQRCIDHASEHQRVQLVNEITYNALTLVQDPYGNYVSGLVAQRAGWRLNSSDTDVANLTRWCNTFWT